MQLASLYRARMKYPEAEAALYAALGQDPNLLEALIEEEGLFYAQRDFRAVVPVLRKILQISAQPSHAAVGRAQQAMFLTHLASSYQELHDYDHAVDTWRQVMLVDAS